MNGNEHFDFWQWLDTAVNNFQIFMSKAVAPLSIAIGAAIKLGDDLVNKRKLTWQQRLGVYVISLGFGFIGWIMCMGMDMDINDWRLVPMISTMTYGGEHILKWIVQNKTKILDYILFRHWNKK